MKFDPYYLFPQQATSTEMKKKGITYCQNDVKICQKFVKKLSTSCEKNVKVVKKLSKFKTSGEEHDDDNNDDDGDEEKDLRLQDQVAISSHLVKIIIKKMVFGQFGTLSWKPKYWQKCLRC
jgi:uncharacterized membrane protein YkoI